MPLAAWRGRGMTRAYLVRCASWVDIPWADELYVGRCVLLRIFTSATGLAYATGWLGQQIACEVPPYCWSGLPSALRKGSAGFGSSIFSLAFLLPPGKTPVWALCSSVGCGYMGVGPSLTFHHGQSNIVVADPVLVSVAAFRQFSLPCAVSHVPFPALPESHLILREAFQEQRELMRGREV